MSENEKAKKIRIPAIGSVKVPVDNPDFNALVDGMTNGTISGETVAENLSVQFTKISASTIYGTYNLVPDGQVFYKSKASPFAVACILKAVGCNPEEFKIENWVLPEKTAPAELVKFDVGAFVKLTNVSDDRKQSPDCIYKVEWTNDNYCLLVPFARMAIDSKGFKVTAPMCSSWLSLKALKPVEVEPDDIKE